MPAALPARHRTHAAAPAPAPSRHVTDGSRLGRCRYRVPTAAVLQQGSARAVASQPTILPSLTLSNELRSKLETRAPTPRE